MTQQCCVSTGTAAPTGEQDTRLGCGWVAASPRSVPAPLRMEYGPVLGVTPGRGES